MGSVQTKILQAIIAAICHNENRGLAAGVKHDAVRRRELAGSAALAAECPKEFSAAVVLIDVARSITVAHKDVTVGRHSQIGWTVLCRGLAFAVQLVELRLARI